MNDKNIIGRKEKVDLPLLNLSQISARVDTGAFTSSIHCSFIQKIEPHKVECIFLDESHPKYTGKKYIFDVIKKVKVKSSNGQSESRYVIQTSMTLLGQTHDVLFTLADRKGMNNPILLGRQFLSHKFIVDVDLKNQ